MISVFLFSSTLYKNKMLALKCFRGFVHPIRTIATKAPTTKFLDIPNGKKIAYEKVEGSAALARAMEQGGFTDGAGRAIATYTWRPEGEVSALVFLCHGYAERLAPYYETLAVEGNKRGFLCFGHDHVGHGVSEGERVQISDMAEYVDPVITHCTTMSNKYPGVPLFMVGHSMGGLITLLTVHKTQVINPIYLVLCNVY